MSNTRKISFLLGGLGLLCAAILYLLGPIPQDPAYHVFADRVGWLGIPNFVNVMTNLPFIVIGAMGIAWTAKNQNSDHPVNQKIIFIFLFTGMCLTGLGSAYYHIHPDHFRLLFDRLPMTLVFMSFFALFIKKFVDNRAGSLAFYTLIPLGVFSALWWYYSETIGQGDLRIYVFVQFFPMLAIPLVIWQNRRLPIKQILWIIGWYIMAKAAELLDSEIFDALHWVSGHSLKHLFAGLACYHIYIWVRGLKAAKP